MHVLINVSAAPKNDLIQELYNMHRFRDQLSQVVMENNIKLFNI